MTKSKPKILLTRSAQECMDDASIFSEMGFDPVLSPLLDIEIYGNDIDNTNDAYLFTSKYGVRALNKKDVNKQCFVIGYQTEKEAKEHGFSDTVYFPDIKTFLESSEFTLNKKLFYSSAEDISHDNLPDNINRKITYKAHLADHLSDQATKIIKDSANINLYVPLYSKRTAQHLSHLLDCENLADALDYLKFICISARVADGLPKTKIKFLDVAKTKDANGILNVLKERIE